MSKKYNCYYDGSANFDNRYILMYWKAKSNSGNSFDVQTYNDLNSWGAEYAKGKQNRLNCSNGWKIGIWNLESITC